MTSNPSKHSEGSATRNFNASQRLRHPPLKLATQLDTRAIFRSWPPEPCSLEVGEAHWDELCLSLRRYFRAMADPSIQESQLSARPWMAAGRFQFGFWKKSRTGEMTTNYQADYKAEQGKKIFGTGVFSFAHGLIWFRSSSPGGIFTLRSLNMFDTFFRAEIVIGAILAAYGILVWRSAFRKLSLANYIIVLSCVPVLLLCVSKLSEWVYFLDQQRGFSILNDLAVGVIQITMVVCIVVFGGWWADSTYMRARFHR